MPSVLLDLNLNAKHCQIKQLIYYYNHANFTTAFLSDKDNFLRRKIHSVRHTHLFNFYWNKIICKRPEVNSEPTHFLTFINNDEAFSILDDMACSYQSLTSFSFYQDTEKPKGNGFRETLKNPIYQKIILIAPEIREVSNSKQKERMNNQFVELLIPTLNKIILNNRQKIIKSVFMVFPSNV